MSDIPVIRSYQSILAGMVGSFTSKTGVRSLAVASPVLSIFEAAARSDLRDSMSVMQMLNSTDLDKSTGLALLRRGRQEGVQKITISPATGKVTISDSSFNKVATFLYQGSPSPIQGSTTVDVVDASLMPNSGAIYIGRGTNSYEGPIPYSSKTNNTSYWTLTLSSAITKFHNSNEPVVLAQGGNRQIGANVTVRTPQGNLSNAVSFGVLFPVTILDGETSISNVDVLAQTSGIVGNVGAGAISEFVSLPFSGAKVTNPSPFTTANDTESDDDYRARIKATRASRAKGTSLAITTSVIGIKAPDENKTLSSASLVRRVGYPTTLYIDDGTGYEEVTTGVGVETLISSATGGEQYFEVANRPIAKAYIESTNAAPYGLSALEQLSVTVGGVTSVHTFNSVDFVSIGNATAYEVCASINGNPNLLFLARTVNSGNNVVLFAKAESNEDIEVNAIDNDANAILGFSTGVSYTTQLYKNDIRLNKDGRAAKLLANVIGSWNAMSGSKTLTISVDGTPAQTYTFTDQDFIDGATGFNSLGVNTLAAWVIVLNAKIPGITAGIDNGTMFIVSNAGASAKSALNITGGTLVSNRMFNIDSDTGLSSDYTLDRNMGELQLTKALAVNDRLSLGSATTRAFVQSLTIPTTTLAATARFWLNTDGDSQQITSGITSTSSLVITVDSIHEWGHILRITGAANTFSNVLPGDWVVLWDSAFDTSIRDAFRVIDCTSTYLLIERRLGLAARGGHRSVAMLPVSTNISRVFTCGGFTGSGVNLNNISSTPSRLPSGVSSACEIFDPNTNTFTVAQSMSTPRAYHTATALNDGRIYVTGGIDDSGNYLTSTEIYDPSTDTWSVKQVLGTGVMAHRAVKLADGTVLVCGGADTNTTSSAASYRYDPVGDTLTTVFSLHTGRSFFGITLLPSGKALVAGGILTGGTLTNLSETFSPGSNSWTASAGSMSTPRAGCSIGLIGTSPTSGICMGNTAGSLHSDAEGYELYTISSDTWPTQIPITLNTAVRETRVATTQDGANYVFHGSYTSGPSETPNTIKWDASGTVSSLGANAIYTEAGPKYGVQPVVLYNNAGTYLNHVVVIGGTQVVKPNGSIDPTSSVELFDGNTGLFSTPDTAAGTVVTAQAGVTFVRTTGRLQELTIPAASNYTATSLVTALNAETTSALANVYQTNKIRINTNSNSLNGDIALVAQNVTANVLGFSTAGNATTNLTGHIGSIESGGSSTGFPSFQSLETRGVFKPSTDATSGLIINNGAVNPSYTVVGLRNWYSGPSASIYKRFGSDYKYVSTILSSTSQGNSSKVEVRSDGIEPHAPYDRVYTAAPFAMGPNDNLVVTVDANVDNEFNIKMGRRLQTASSTYAQTNAFKDNDAAGVSMFRTFGGSYRFEDFAVYMRSRGVLFSDASPNQKMLARYFRYGSEGDRTRIRFSNPLAANSVTSVSVDVDTNNSTDVRIYLPGGAARNPVLRGSTKIGRASTSVLTNQLATLVFALNLPVSSGTRTSNVTTLTLTLPTAITDHGLNVNDTIWLQSTSGSFVSNSYLITSRTSTTISFTDVAANAGPISNIGTVSFDPQGEATLSGSGTVVGDFLNYGSVTAGTFFNSTFYINTVNTGSVIVTSGEATGFSAGSTLVWSNIDSPSAFKIFANTSPTANTIIASVNALGNKNPISLTVLGTGTGTILQSTPEFAGDASFWYTLSDGLNWVKKTIPAASSGFDYQLTFKNAVNGSLATNSDWVNEIVYVCPVTVDNLVEWFNTPTITGLFTKATINASDDGTRLQIASRSAGSVNGIQVQGGLANLATGVVVGGLRVNSFTSINTLSAADSAGLSGGMWVKINNTLSAPKPVIGDTDALTSWDPTGLIIVSDPLYLPRVTPQVAAKLAFERQGDYVAISDFGEVAGLSFNNVLVGDYLRITTSSAPTAFTQVSSPNLGIFKVIRVVPPVGESGGTIWINNPGVVEETSECNMAVYTGDSSVMPGDILSVGTSLWGSENQGLWTVVSVGTTTATSNDPFTVNTHMMVSTATRTPQPVGGVPALGSQVSNVSIIEGTPSTFIMKVLAISPNQTDGSFVDVTWDLPVSTSTISKTVGSIVNVANKLGFGTDFVAGADGYSYDIGLIGEANKVLYGDQADPATYPGIVSDGSNVNIAGPLVKRVQMILGIRVKSPATENDVAARVRTTVAAVINKTKVGQNIAIADIVSAAQSVVGVVAVTVISPTYGIGNDLISIQPYERPFVLDLNTDIQIVFTGN